jgi:hypothetical protein
MSIPGKTLKGLSLHLIRVKSRYIANHLLSSLCNSVYWFCIRIRGNKFYGFLRRK